MNVASLIIGLPRYGVGAGNPTLKDSVSRSGNRGATHAEGGAGTRCLFYGRWSSASKHIVFGASDHAPPNFNIPHARIF